MSLFDKNLALLRNHDPALARRVEKLSPAVTAIPAKNGLPTLNYQSVYLHSAYDPESEAKKLTVDFSEKPGSSTVVFGLGLGYHLAEILKVTKEKVSVVEPLLAVFHAFLTSIDLQPFLPRVYFIIAEPAPKVLSRNKWQTLNIFAHNPSVQISKKYFADFTRGCEVADYLAEHPLKALVVNPIYGGSLPTARYCAQALTNLGHVVESVNCEQFADSFSALDKAASSKANKEVLSKLFMNFISEVIVAKAAEFKPDIILALAQAPLNKETVARLKALEVPIAFWFVEDFRTLTYWKDIAHVYDYFFTIQKGDFFAELESRKSANHYYLPQACLPSQHKPVQPSEADKEKYEADLSFMGEAYYNRVQAFPQLLNFDFKIWGTGWGSYPGFAPYLQNNGERVSSDECVKIFNNSKINLNLHSSTFHQDVNPHGDFVNPRTLEVAACSAFQLVDSREELYDMFRVGEEIIDYKTMDELKGKISYYLAHDGERLKIAAKGFDRVLREHTMEHRMKEMLICIFTEHFERLRKRLDQRKSKVDLLIEQAGPDTELGRYLDQFDKNDKDFSLKSIVSQIEMGKGSLTKNELLLLMMDQVVVSEG